jgi:diguanylate cyclase (GGDEF)-like protein/PAS domain S-box-containing protein
MTDEMKFSPRFAECVLLAEPNILYIYDLESKRPVYVNPEVTTVLGYTQANIEAMGADVLPSLIHSEDLAHVVEHMQECSQAGDGDVLEIEYRLRHAYGDWHWFSSRSSVYARLADGKALQILGIAVDMTERRAAQEKLWFASTHDGLTGLYNRSMFETEVDRLEKSRRYPVTVLIADVVGLRKINEEHGYEAGDERLRSVAEILREAFRSDDVVARMGADKFGVLLPNTSQISMEAFQARVVSRLENYNRSHPGAPVALTMSIVSAENGTSLRETVMAAEKRMVEIKDLR